jgi:hypothetical protein
MAKQLYHVIIFFKPETGRTPAKYRNVSTIENLTNKARNWGGWYMNLYFKETREFARRIYL